MRVLRSGRSKVVLEHLPTGSLAMNVIVRSGRLVVVDQLLVRGGRVDVETRVCLERRVWVGGIPTTKPICRDV